MHQQQKHRERELERIRLKRAKQSLATWLRGTEVTEGAQREAFRADWWPGCRPGRLDHLRLQALGGWSGLHSSAQGGGGNVGEVARRALASKGMHFPTRRAFCFQSPTQAVRCCVPLPSPGGRVAYCWGLGRTSSTRATLPRGRRRRR